LKTYEEKERVFIERHSLGTRVMLRSLKNYLVHPIQAFRADREDWGNHFAFKRLMKSGLIDDSLKRKRNDPGYPPRWNDLENIYRLVRQRKPRVVFELGSGYSTFFFIRALQDNYVETKDRGFLYSYDGSKKWLEHTEQHMPPDLRRFVKFRHGVEEVRDYDGTELACCVNAPEDVPNFIYLDGLSSIEGYSSAGILLEYEGNAPEDWFILVDGRKREVKILRDHLKRDYKITTERVYNRTTFELMLD
jgi:hypothetical protein